MKRFIAIFLAAAGLASASSALAAEAYLIDSTDLFAGPDIDYPQITALPAGIPVSVYGCTNGWEWCDVQAENDRGWVSGEFLQYPYQNQRVLLPTYGARIGIPIISFVLGTYWGSHYSHRSWYGQRDEWSHRSFAHRAAPRPHMRTQAQPAARPAVQAARPAMNRQPKAEHRAASNRIQAPRNTQPAAGLTRAPSQRSAPTTRSKPTPAAQPTHSAPHARQPTQHGSHASAAPTGAAQRPAAHASNPPKSAKSAKPARPSKPEPKKDSTSKDIRDSPV